jgi:hypothetical protein
MGEVDPPRKIAWSGVTFGIQAIDVFRLEPRDGATLVSEEESWDGLLARLLGGLSNLRPEVKRSVEEPRTP